MENYLSRLNEAQLLPVKDTEGAVLVIAGAGSGKTRVLTSRIAYLVNDKGVSPSSILAITFTNKAAGEMRDRLNSMVDGASNMWICTIHSMCVKILRMFGESVGFEQNFSIYSEAERITIIKKCIIECGLGKSEEGKSDEAFFKNIKFHIGNAKMLGSTPDRYYKENYGMKNNDEVFKIYSAYEKHLRLSNALDFDDLLIYSLKLLTENKDAQEYLSGKFKYVHVDEFQDTNTVQYKIIKLISSTHKNLFVVGDDDQSIYSWRGAKIENILNFEKDFKDAKVYKLEQNYRSTKNILELANEVVKHNSKRKSKELWTDSSSGEKPVYYQASDEAEEALYTAQQIRKLCDEDCSYSDFAVLMRLNALTRSYEQEFAKYGIPFKVFGGFKFYERKEIKDMLAYLRLISNPNDSDAIIRIINVPKRGIGVRTIEVLEEYANSIGGTIFDALIDIDCLDLNAGAKAKLKAFYSLIKDLIIKGEELDIARLTRYIITQSMLLTMYEGNSDEAENKRANINEFVNSVEEFEKLNNGATITDYLQQVSLFSDLDSMDESNYVTIATIHAVKGLEFNNVFVCGLEEGIMPVSRAYFELDELEEERRLMYVAITRARKRLFLTRCQSRFMYGQRKISAQSRFLTELSTLLGIKKTSPKNEQSSSYGGYNKYSGYGNSYSNSSYGASGVSVSDTIAPSDEPIGSFSSTFKRSSEKSSSTQKDLSLFKAGVKVRHTKFGEGTIISTRSQGSNLILDVAFDGLGIKQLSAALAPLEII